MDVNFTIFQIQAFARFYFAMMRQPNPGSHVSMDELSRFLLDMCQDVVNSKSWKYELRRGSRFSPNLRTIEIACGLDALADGARVVQAVMAENGDAVHSFYSEEQCWLLRNAIENAVDFLQWVQEQVPPETVVGRGGLGYGGVQVLEQRLDVTGHAISALTKLYSTTSNFQQ